MKINDVLTVLCMTVVCGGSVGTALAQGGGGIKIIKANYFVSTSPNANCDATGWVADRCEGKEQCTFTVVSTMCGDPDEHAGKTLDVTYSCANRTGKASGHDNGIMTIRCP
jgi:hypothetical protein